MAHRIEKEKMTNRAPSSAKKLTFGSEHSGQGTENTNTAPATECKISAERKQINSYFQKLKFRKAFFGADEQDVWKKLAELNALYENELRAERIRYDVLLAEYRQSLWLSPNGFAGTATESVSEDSHEP